MAGNTLTVIANGTERRDALIALIDSAERSVHMMFYMFEDDDAGSAVLTALLRARTRGVSVALIIDSFGSSRISNGFFAPLVDAGGVYRVFSRRWRSSYLIRNHQKFVVADGARAMTGGFNVGAQYLAPDDQPDRWSDLAVVIEGPAVAALDIWFAKLRHFVEESDGKWRTLRAIVKSWPPEDASVQWLLGGPMRRLSPWAQSVKRDLEMGTRLDLVMAYFAPSRGMLRRIGLLAGRGTARLVLPAKSDNGATIGAARLLYGPMLKRKVAVFEFLPVKLHSKIIVIDDVTYLGSANFDMRSLFLNVELMLRIEDAAFAQAMRGLVDSYIGWAEPITRERHRERANILTRVRWTLSWALVAVIDYTVARRFNFGLRESD